MNPTRKRILLHIGRHKSGTTSLQQFFYLNREALQALGVYYPATAIRNFGHHLLAEPFPMRRINQLRARYQPQQHPLVQDMRAEIDACEQSTVLISSEAFQNMDPVNARKIFEGYDVEVVVYLRDQLSYLVSSYAQEVHADNQLTDDILSYYLKVFSGAVNYYEFLEKWAEVFGSNLKVRLFDRKALYQQNVVDDFCHSILGLDVSSGFEMPELSNPSIAGELIEYKRLLNYFVPEHIGRPIRNRLYSYLPEYNQDYAKSRLYVPPVVRKMLAIDIGNSNKKLSAKYLSGVQLDDVIAVNIGQHMQPVKLEEAPLLRLLDDLKSRVPGLAEALSGHPTPNEVSDLLATHARWLQKNRGITAWRRYKLLIRRLRRWLSI